MRPAINLPPLIAIGYISSCYQENFGIPRQAGLVKSAKSIIVLPKTTAMLQATEGLTNFSHLWVLFYFHALKRSSWKPRVRPPRLGGDTTAGVFTTRSPYRPNPIGLSAVALRKVTIDDCIRLHVEGGDFLDGTPVVDIKPYLPYCDAIPDAQAAWAATAPTCGEVCFAPEAEQQLTRFVANLDEAAELRTLITATLALDPRPSYQRRRQPEGEPGKQWSMQLAGFDVSWTLSAALCTVINIRKLER